MCRNTCERGERGFLEPKSPVGPTQDEQKTRLKRFGALAYFERMEVRTLRCLQASSMNLMKETNGYINATSHTVFTQRADSLRDESSRGAESP